MQIEMFKDRYEDRTCYILGNGPSLKDVDLESLEHPTFGTNRIYLSGFTPTFYVCVNKLLYEQYFDEIAGLDSYLFLNQWAPEHEIVNDIVNIDTTGGYSFRSPEQPMWEGHTVTYVCLQLAYYMGFTRVILLGVDHFYGDYADTPNKELISMGPDEHHFHPDYFGKGAVWNAPDLEASEQAYMLAKYWYEKDERVIINASSFSKLKVFKQVPLKHIDTGYPVSAIVSAYHAEDTLEGCLEDLYRQTLRPEIVVIAKRNSIEAMIAAQFREKPGVSMQLRLTDGIPTVYEAWNLGVRVARGRYLTNANCDDRHADTAFEMQYVILESRPDIDLVYYNSWISWENDTFLTFLEKNQDYFEDFILNMRDGETPSGFVWPDYSYRKICTESICGPQPMWRANLHQKYGLFTSEFKVAGDYEFFLRCAGPANYYHLNMFLGVYNANLHGVELSNPIDAANESSAAIIMNQNPIGLDVHPIEASPNALIASDAAHYIVDKKSLCDILEG